MKKVGKRKLVLKLHFEGKRNKEIVGITQLSPQRVSQLITNYKPGTRAKMKSVIFPRDNYECQMKSIKCKSKLTKEIIIHHIDLNSHNNSLENLITLCTGCHYFVHSLEKEEVIICAKCGCKELKKKPKKELCRQCLQEYRTEQNIERIKNKKCSVCFKSIPFVGYNTCSTCYSKKRYDLNKEKRTEQNLRWRRKNPEKVKEIARRGYHKNRLEILKKMKEYYKKIGARKYEKLKNDPVRWEAERNRQRQLYIRRKLINTHPLCNP